MQAKDPTTPGGSAEDGGSGAPPPDVLPPGSVPDHDLLRCIGRGSYGDVWLARSVMGSYRAVKIVHRKSFTEDRPYEREFKGIRHFEPLSRSHPGLVQILQVGRNDEMGYYYCLMELADDLGTGRNFAPVSYEPKTLGKLITRFGKLDVGRCIEIGLVLTDALAYLHDHDLIHRDIKPSNIIFVEARPKFADIGLVTEIGDGRTIVGTEGYFPLEGPGKPPGDVYSLGKVLYEASTGLNRERFPDLPTQFDEAVEPGAFQGLNRIILRACESNVQNRYQSARQMHEALLHLQASLAHTRGK